MKKEQDFYKPIKKHFEKQGFSVKAEVKNCDCVCIKNDLIIICEFKLNFNISLVFQGLERQKITDYVYLCVPKYKGRVGYRNFLKAKSLCKRLGLGFIIVNSDDVVDVVLEPTNIEVRKNKKKQQNLLKEYNGRTFDLNSGGQTRKKINTAFKEANIKVLCILEIEKEVSGNILHKKYGFDKNITGLLYRNTLKYFIKTQKRGFYEMSQEGKNALFDENNKKLVEFFRDNLKKY